MAGLFQVLWGEADGTFRPAEPLRGSDGEPLILPTGGGEDDVVDKICTRPFAVDWDGDGELDLVTGNFIGTFAWFRGEGAGRFAPQCTWLEADGERLSVRLHSDPFVIDWDGDGDLDLLSGSGGGGAFLFVNVGTRTAPKFASTPVTLLADFEHEDGAEERFGDAHVVRPTHATRIWIADVNGDGKLDLLLGDQIQLQHLQEGVTEAAAKAALADWGRRQQELFASMPQGEPTPEQEAKWSAAWDALLEERKKFVREDATGFVWLLQQK